VSLHAQPPFAFLCFLNLNNPCIHSFKTVSKFLQSFFILSVLFILFSPLWLYFQISCPKANSLFWFIYPIDGFYHVFMFAQYIFQLKNICLIFKNTFISFLKKFFIHLFTCAYIVWVISPPCFLPLPSPPTPSRFQAETVLPLSLILLKRRHKQ
jgi:hypothetical protein